jgi:pimeloyl-ACP methyl ester carboxylesterase
LGGALLDEYREACEVWDVPAADRARLGPSSPLSIPTLLLSGARDPVTPPENAERLRALLPVSRHVVFPRGGHGYSGVEPQCAARMTAAFVRDPRPVHLDDGCSRRAP